MRLWAATVAAGMGSRLRNDHPVADPGEYGRGASQFGVSIAHDETLEPTPRQVGDCNRAHLVARLSLSFCRKSDTSEA